MTKRCIASVGSAPSDNDKPVTVVKALRSKRGKKKKGTNKPKKAMTPFMVFSKETRKLLVANNPSMTFSEIGKELGSRWRAMGETEKEDYVVKANKDYERFLAESEKFATKVEHHNGKQRTKQEQEDTKVKKSMSAYLYFCNAHRNQVKARHPELKMVEIQRLLATEWMHASAAVKLPFEKQAEADRTKYKTESKLHNDSVVDLNDKGAPEIKKFSVSKRVSVEDFEEEDKDTIKGELELDDDMFEDFVEADIGSSIPDLDGIQCNYINSSSFGYNSLSTRLADSCIKDISNVNIGGLDSLISDSIRFDIDFERGLFNFDSSSRI